MTVSDQSGTIRLTLWQSEIDSLKLETTYSFTNLSVQTYMNTKYLSHAMSGLECSAIDDIGDVMQLNVDQPGLLKQAIVVVVLNVKKD